MARDYKKEYQQALQLGISGPGSLQHERQRARRMVDKTGKDANGNGKADAREGKDIDHKKPLRAGGKSTKENLRIRSKKANQSDNGK
jgi:hypothetical protein